MHDDASASPMPPVSVARRVCRRQFAKVASATVLTAAVASAGSWGLSGSAVAPKGATILSRHAESTGVGDAAPGILAAVAAAVPVRAFATPLKQVFVDKGRYAIRSRVDLTGENVMFVGGGGVFVPAIGQPTDSQGRQFICFTSRRGILEFDGVEFRGDANEPDNARGNTYIILARGDPMMERVAVRNCVFENCNAVGSKDKVRNLLVTHAIYLEGVTEAIIEGNTCDGVSGAAVFLKRITKLSQRGNTWRKTGWYSTQVDHDVSGEIVNDVYDCSDTRGIYKGGAINTVNGYGSKRNTRIRIAGCRFSGYFSYGAVIRCQSDDGIVIEDNVFGLCQLGSMSRSGAQLTAIRVLTRARLGGHPTSSEPPRNVVIRRNQAVSGLGGGLVSAGARPFIYVSNDWDTSRNPIVGVRIEDNSCFSPTSAFCFTHGVIIHGRTGGIENVEVTGNNCEVYLRSASPVDGGLSFVAMNRRGLVDGVRIGGNRIRNLQPPSTPVQVCILIGSGVDRVINVQPNTVIGGYYGVRLLKGAGPVLMSIDNQQFENCLTDMKYY